MSDRQYFEIHESPLGKLLLASDGKALTGLFTEDSEGPVPGSRLSRDGSPFTEVRRQLDDYFEGRRTRFDLSLAPAGTPFQRRVWAALQAIPFGETASYGEVATRMGSPRAVRAVGGANGRNPIAVIIPCHRVIRADGSLGGYGGGTWRKEFLVEHERRVASTG